MPSVPCAHVTTGKPPLGAGPFGTTTIPVTGTGLPVWLSETYMTRYIVPSTSGALTFSDLMTAPGFDGILLGTA